MIVSKNMFECLDMMLGADIDDQSKTSDQPWVAGKSVSSRVTPHGLFSRQPCCSHGGGRAELHQQPGQLQGAAGEVHAAR